MGAPKRLSAARRGALVNDSARWMDRFAKAATWFKDRAELRAAIERAPTDTGRETHRDRWARHVAVSAATLKAAPDTAE